MYHLLTTSLDCSSLIAGIKNRYKFPTAEETDRIIAGMREFGLFSNTVPTLVASNVFDTLCHQLARLLSFKPGERDLVILQHKFVVEWADGKQVGLPPV